jgi:hypothetical protein
MFRWVAAVLLLMCVVWSRFSSADEVTFRIPRTGKDAKKGEVTKLKGRIDPDRSNASKIVLAIGKEEETIEVINIEGIAYDKEPTEFAAIRASIASGNYSDAVDELHKLAESIKAGNTPAINPDSAAQKDFNFWIGYLPTMQAVEGSAKVDPAATKKLLDFLAANSTHYRFYEGTEALGALAFRMPGDPLAASKQYYTKIATNTELPEIAFRGKLLMARGFLKANNPQQAVPLLTGLIAEKAADSRIMASQIAQAKIAFAQATIAAGKPDDALKLIHAVLDETPSYDTETTARANIALGNALLAKQNKTEALIAFLKVELLFNQYPEQRAEALARLAKLWNEIPSPRADRANESRDRLQNLYPFANVK